MRIDNWVGKRVILLDVPEEHPKYKKEAVVINEIGRMKDLLLRVKFDDGKDSTLYAYRFQLVDDRPLPLPG